MLALPFTFNAAAGTGVVVHLQQKRSSFRIDP
jgi:hypothetical protein